MPQLILTAGRRLNYLDLNPPGHPSVLLLHGLGATGDSWGYQFPALTAAGYRVLAPDARGFGRSTYLGGPASIRRMADDMATLLEKLDSGPAHVVGISMGGTLAQSLALSQPQHVRRLVLVNTFARLRPQRPGDVVYFLTRFLLVHLLGLPTQARFVSGRLFPRPEDAELRQQFMQQVLQADPNGYRAAMRALARFNVYERLSEISAPTLVITGECDTTVAPHLQAELARGIPHARQVFVPGAGHGVSVEQPERFNRLLLDFLGEAVETPDGVQSART